MDAEGDPGAFVFSVVSNKQKADGPFSVAPSQGGKMAGSKPEVRALIVEALLEKRSVQGESFRDIKAELVKVESCKGLQSVSANQFSKALRSLCFNPENKMITWTRPWFGDNKGFLVRLSF